MPLSLPARRPMRLSGRLSGRVPGRLPERRPAARLPARLLGAAVCGAVLAAAFEPLSWGYLLPIAVAGVTLLLRGLGAGRGWWVGCAFGVAFMLALLPWLRVIGVDAWILLATVEGAFYGLVGAGTAVLLRLRWWPAWVAMLWAAVELVRSSFPFGGFPWGRLAFAAAGTPAADLLRYLGAAGTGFVLALLGTTAAWAVLRARRSPGRAAAALAMPVLLVGAAEAIPLAALPPADGGRTVTVAAVQGDVPGVGMDAFAERRAVLENHVAATHRLAERVASGEVPAPDLVVWPENSTDIDPFADPTVYADIQGAVDAVGVPVLVGAMVGGTDPEDVFNQGIVWLPGQGPVERYSKTHPVPFGEYIPLRDLIAPLVGRLDQIPRDMVAGSEPGLLSMGETLVGDVICFEIAYDDVVREVAGGGAEMLVVQTNNATYMGTGQIEQQFDIARLRAIETGRHVVVVATNGVSGIIAPDGHVVDRAPVRTQAVLTHALPVVEGLTPALRWGRAIDLLLVTGAGLALVAALVAGRRSRRTEESDPGAEADRAAVPAEAGRR